MALILPRRRFLAGLVGIIAAPAVVKVESLMKVASPPLILAEPEWESFSEIVFRSLQHFNVELADNLNTHNALMMRLRQVI